MNESFEAVEMKSFDQHQSKDDIQSKRKIRWLKNQMKVKKR